jgi:hypothetical protein
MINFSGKNIKMVERKAEPGAKCTRQTDSICEQDTLKSTAWGNQNKQN